jgi:hypothetical protein
MNPQSDPFAISRWRAEFLDPALECSRPAMASNGWPITILEIVGFPMYLFATGDFQLKPGRHHDSSAVDVRLYS